MALDLQVQVDWDRQEEIEYCAGQRVELKQRPGVVDIIAAYDRMMVPPIWLTNDPQPRYPEELSILSESTGWLEPTGCKQVLYPACQLC